MSRLGIDPSTGLIYEGLTNPSYPVWPTPVVSQATLIETPQDFGKIPDSFHSHPSKWIFREDSFDAVSRIRRGRIFQNFDGQSRQSMWVEPHPAIHSDMRSVTANGSLRKELGVFMECTELLGKANKGQGMRLAIGVSGAYSLWRIVQTERIVSTDILVTLRAESAFGILPEIETSKIHPENLPHVESEIS